MEKTTSTSGRTSFYQKSRTSVNIKDLPPVPKYDPLRFPGDLTLAEIHGRAKRVYNRNLLGTSRKCTCCGLPCDNLDSLDLTCSIEDFNHLGEGYPMFFTLAKDLLVLLMIVFATSGLYGLITNLQSSDCSPSQNEEGNYCDSGLATQMTLTNKRNQQDLITTQFTLDIISIFLMSCYLVYMRIKNYNFVKKIANENLTPADFTLQLSNVPIDSTESYLKKYIEEMSTPAYAISVVKVMRTYQISDFVKMLEAKESVQRELETAEGEEAKKYREKMYTLNYQIDKENSKLQYGDVAFVIFQTKRQAQFVYNRKKISSLRHVLNKFTGKPEIEVRLAPQPTDINWENLNQKPLKKFLFRLLSVLTRIILLLFSTIIIIGILGFEYDHAADITDILVPLFSIGFSIAILLLNKITSGVMVYLANKEKHATKTNSLSSVASGYFLQRILTVCVALILAHALIVYLGNTDFFQNIETNNETSNLLIPNMISSNVTNIFESDQSIVFRQLEINITNSDLIKFVYEANFYGTGGIVYNTFWLMVSGCFSMCLSSLIDVDQLIKYWRLKKIRKNPSSNKYAQRRVNKLFEGGHFMIEKRYGYLIAAVSIALLYGTIIPIGLVITAMGIIAYYWISKYHLLRQAKLPNGTGKRIAIDMLNLLRYGPFFYAFGMFMACYTLDSGYINDNTASFIGSNMFFGIWVAGFAASGVAFIPGEHVYSRFFFKGEDSHDHTSYNDAKKEFFSDYEVENPVTRKLAFDKFLKEAVGTSEEEKMKYLKNQTGGNSEMNEFMNFFNNRQLGKKKR